MYSEQPINNFPNHNVDYARRTKRLKLAFVSLLSFAVVIAGAIGILLHVNQNVQEASLDDIVANVDQDAALLPLINGAKPAELPHQKNVSYDVVVVGAGSGGTAAAIQAARMGSSVAIVEETDWIGGQMTSSAVSAMDDKPSDRQNGIYKEFIDRIQAYYKLKNKSTNTCKFRDTSVCFEPSVGQKILKQMLYQSRNVTVYTRTPVNLVMKVGDKVNGLQTENGLTFNSKVVIDATEYGDVLPLAGAAYRVGNSVSDNINPTACIQDITYTAVIKKYPGGVPDNLKIKTEPKGYQANKAVFAAMVANEGNNNYFYDASSNSYPVTFANHNKYRGLPDSSNSADYHTGSTTDGSDITRTEVNWANDFPAQSIYLPQYKDANPTLPVSYIENKNTRQSTNCAAKLETLQFIYYIQHELGVKDWSIANDEGFDTSYNQDVNDCPELSNYKDLEKFFPVMPYVRESRRMIGMDTLTGPEIKRQGTPPVSATNSPTAVALGSYGTDLHNCGTADTLEADLESISDTQTTSGNFQIPFETLVPEKVDGLLAAEKNISVSRLVNGATRVQPVTMLTGQAAGVIAALAAKSTTQPRNINPHDVQTELINAGALLKLDGTKGYPSDKAEQISSVNNQPPLGSAAITPTNFLTTPPSTVSVPTTVVAPAPTPLTPVTRAKAADALNQKFNLLNNAPVTPSFSDTPKTHQYYLGVEALHAKKITSGCAINPLRFCPDQTITRRQFAIFLARTINPNVDTQSAVGAQHFTDMPSSNSAYKAVQYLFSKGIIQGCTTTTFCPEDTLNQQQLDALISRS